MNHDRAVGTDYVFPPGAPRAATLVLVVGPEGHREVVLTERAHHLSFQPGDVALPGGRIDEGESSWDAALREAREELGIATDGIVPIGVLGDFRVAASRYRVTAHVGLLASKPRFAADPNEVERVILVPLRSVLDLEYYSEIPSPRSPGTTTVLFESPGARAFGATGRMMLAFAQRWHEGQYRSSLGAPATPNALHRLSPQR